MSSTECEYSFGDFRLFPAQQLLLERDSPVRLGARALELLTVLVEKSGELVTKDELVARLWPTAHVADSNLKVQVATLRRALGECKTGQRYVATTNGRGYRFVAPVKRHNAKIAGTHCIPSSAVPPLGRDECLDWLQSELSTHRFISIVGPGGIGKTTVAIELAKRSVREYPDGVWFVDLSPLASPDLVTNAIAAALSSRYRLDADPAALASSLLDKGLLIILDCCEHLIDGTAAIAAEIYRRSGSKVHVIATSREPLRAEGEKVYRLPPLDTPGTKAPLRAAEAVHYSAIQLFVDRASEVQHEFELNDANAGTIAEICRRLDGLPLAIELAARRADAFGPRELLSVLTNRFDVLTKGRRTDQPRHQTLAAAIDWSYGLLTNAERTLLRRLSIFAGSFTLQAAHAVTGDADLWEADISAGVGNLVAKSMLSVEMQTPQALYRLPDSMRVYAEGKQLPGEQNALARRHAEYLGVLLCRAEAEWGTSTRADWIAKYGHCVDDTRKALDWSFSDRREVLGVTLASASVPLWTSLCLIDECRHHTGRALAARWDRSADGGSLEMKLSAAFASSLLQTRGPLRSAYDAWKTTAKIAARLGERRFQIQGMWGLCDYHTWLGEHSAALRLSQRIREVAVEAGDHAAAINVGRQAGTALRYLGKLSEARDRLEQMIDGYVEPVHWADGARFHVDPRIVGRGTLANVLWLQGWPVRAAATSRLALDAAKAANHPLALCNAYAHTAIPIALYVDDWSSAGEWVREFFAHISRDAMPIWDAIGRCLKGIMEIGQGSPADLDTLREALNELGRSDFRLRYPAYLGTFSVGLSRAGRHEEARLAIEDALALARQHEENWCVGELIRVKGEVIYAHGLADCEYQAETLFVEAWDLARELNVPPWEYRAVLSLARLWSEQGKRADAERLTQALAQRFETYGISQSGTLLQSASPIPAVLA